MQRVLRHVRPVALAASASFLCIAASSGQVVSNIKFSNGTAPVLNGARFEILPGSGQQVGGNLFHSFSEFSVGQGSSAVFKTPSNVSRILARVTGGNASQIDGTLRTEMENSSDLSGASLYLINPSGIIFGSNAKLEVGGAFIATTADYVKLADGGRFDARDGANDVLTTAPVTAFGFVSQLPAKITAGGATLEVASNRSISLVGGEIALAGSVVRAPGGGVSLLSVASAGEAAAQGGSMPDRISTLGSIVLDGTRLDADGPGGGRVAIRSGQLQINGGSVTARTLGALDGGGIDIEVTGQLSLSGGSVESSTLGTGAGGPINIAAQSIYVDGRNLPRSGFFSETSGGAQDVDVLLDITHTYDDDLRATLISPAGTRVVLFDSMGSFRTIASGRANFTGTVLDDEAPGQLVVSPSSVFTGRYRPLQPLSVYDAENLNGTWRLEVSDLFALDSGTLNGWALTIGGHTFSSTGTPTPIVDVSTVVSTLLVDLAARPTGGGQGGNVDIHTALLSLKGGAQISTATAGRGSGGNITIDANLATLGENSSIRSETGGLGDAGGIFLQVSTLDVRAGSRVSASTSGLGKGGPLEVRADAITIDGQGLTTPRAGLFADTTGPGQAGAIYIRTGSLEVLHDGQLSSQTSSTGRGGNIDVDAEFVRLGGGSDITTGILTETRLNGATGGDSGGIRVHATHLIVADNAVIDSRTNTSGGKAGDIEIESGDLLVDNGSILGKTQAEHFGGTAGDITIYAGLARLLHGGEIEAGGYESTGDGGSIRIVSDALLVSGANEFGLTSRIDAVSGAFTDFGPAGHAGSVEITAHQLSVSNNGEIAVTSGFLDYPSFVGGPSGSLRIHADNMAVSGGAIIAASTFSSNPGGSVDLNVAHGLRITDHALITASTGGPNGTGRGGDITIRAGQLEMSDGGGLSVISRSTGDAGDLTVAIDGSLTLLRGSLISADSVQSGNGGSVRVASRSLVADSGSAILASAAGSGSAGDIEIDTTLGVRLHAGSAIATTATVNRAGQITIASGADIRLSKSAISVQALAGDAGTITLHTLENLSLQKSSIIAEAGGSGGDILLDAGALSLDGSRITANATAGKGGQISIQIPAAGVFGDARDFVIASRFIEQSSDSRISASSAFGVQGSLVISAPFVDLAGSLESLNAALFDASTELRDQCARKLQQDFSSYLRLGRGGQAEGAEEFGASF